MSHPYRDPAVKAEPRKKSSFANAAKAFAIAGSLWAGYECMVHVRELDSSLRSDSSYGRAEAYDRARGRVEDARSALEHSAEFAAIICSGEGMCIPIINPGTPPNTARAGDLLSAAEQNVASESLRSRISRIRQSLPQNPSTGADVELCDRLRGELGEVASSIARERTESLGTESTGIETAKRLYGMGGFISLGAILLLAMSMLPRREMEKK